MPPPMEEELPSGQLDSARVGSARGPQSDIWDIADEEVHFSRDAISNHHHHHQAPFAQLTADQQRQHQIEQHQPVRRFDSSLLLSDVSLTSGGGGGYQPVFRNAALEQAKSSKLLNSIGSKLRRGSNYLVAPKLVGQYLLGITIQNWSEFLDTSKMMRAPCTTSQLTRRLLANLSHFQGNYLCVSLILIIYCILTSPLLLLAIIAYLAALYLVTARSATGRQLTLAGFRPNLHQQYSFITLISLPLLWVAGAPSAVFWVIGASFVVVGLHASMYSSTELPAAAAASAGLAGAEYHHHQHTMASGAHYYQLRAPSSTGAAASSTTAVQYYNHYPASASVVHQRPAYMPIQSAEFQRAAPPPPPPLAPVQRATYANSLAQWMMFGASKNQPAAAANSSCASPKEPEVTIISQHYAGLGRVYEV